MGSVELITGPAGAGKTDFALNSYRRHLREELRKGRFGTALWLTPSRLGQQTVLGKLLSAEQPICLDPRVETFGQFVERILASAPNNFRPLSQVGRRKLVRDVIDQLHQARRLKHFELVAATKGFLDLCVSFIAELKREEIWPEHFQQAFQRIQGESGTDGNTDVSHRLAELALIYENYQSRLRGGRPLGASPDGRPDPGEVYDTEGRFWIARTLLRDGHFGPYAAAKLVIVDGFSDFTSTQIEILASLADSAERMFITLPLDEEDRRRDLFLKCLASRDELRKAFSAIDIRERRLRVPADPPHSTFAHLSRYLFDNPREIPRSGRAADCEILACIRPGGEINAILARVKKLLLAGVAPEQIAVVFRSPDGVAERIRAACAAARIPALTETGPPVLAAGSVRMALAILALEREDWPHARLMGLLNSTLFRPQWKPGKTPDLVRRIGLESRRENLDRGREAFLAHFERLASRDAEESNSNHERESAAALLRWISNELRVLRDRISFGDWIDRWLAVCRAFGITPSKEIPDETAPAWQISEIAGWKAMLRLIEDARKVESLNPDKPRMLNLDEFRDQVLELVAGQYQESATNERGRVRILSAESARHLEVDHLFVCGMGEGIFPAGRGEDCLLGDADRKRLADLGMNVDQRSRRSAEEMLLFYSVAARARRSLTLSFASVNDQGETLNASPYLDAIQNLFEPDGCPITNVGRLDPVPESREQCANEADLRLVATRELLEGSGGLWAALAERPESRETTLNLAAAFEMSIARFATHGLTNYEGVLNDPRNLERLRTRFGREHEFSVTELERYATDPFEFFLTSVLGVDTTNDPGPGTDRRQRGVTLHASLAALHRQLSENGDQPSREELLAALREEIAERHRTSGDSPLLRALRAIEGEILAGYANRYVIQWDDYDEKFGGVWDGGPRPRHFEISFGNTPVEEGDEDAPRHPTVEFGAGDHAVRVRGRIDRIDIGTIEGRPVFNIVDYKLAKNLAKFSDEDLDSGRALQLVVYGAAARRLGLIVGDLYQFGYWGLEEQGFVVGMKSGPRKLTALEEEFRERIEERLDEILPRIVESIRAGHFAPNIKEDSRPHAAGYRAVARTASLRAVGEHLEKHPAALSETTESQEVT